MVIPLALQSTLKTFSKSGIAKTHLSVILFFNSSSPFYVMGESKIMMVSHDALVAMQTWKKKQFVSLHPIVLVFHQLSILIYFQELC
jgi:hypothetical protein